MNADNNTVANKKDITKNALTPGTILEGKRFTYTVKKVLGRGSFGITYQATIKLQGELGTITSKVALKEFYMGDINGREGSHVTSGNKEGMVQDYRKKFIREALNLGDVNHEHIINVMEVFEANGTVYYAMQYIEGGSLDDRIKQLGRLSEAETITLTLKLADALSALHARGMLHLDIKPSNVMLTEDLNPVLIDFGLSKHFDENGAPEASTKIGAGTPGYAPVEQASYRVGKGIPVTMDVYALGATMFKMLTGKRPPEASVILNSIENPADHLRNAGISEELSSVVVKAMSALIRDRYQTMDELMMSLPGGDAIIASRGSKQTQSVIEESSPEVTTIIDRAPDGTPIVEPTPIKMPVMDSVTPKEPTPKEPTPVKEQVSVSDIAETQSEANQMDESVNYSNVIPEEYPEKKKLKWVPLVVGLVVGIAIVAGIAIFYYNKQSGAKAEKEELVDNSSSKVTDMIITTPLGEGKYTGDVNENQLPDGKGIAKFNDGSIYDGDWKAGVMEGEAKFTLHNGDIYEGSWVNNQYDEGKYTSKADGSYYVGKFKDGLGYEGGGFWYSKDGAKLSW